MLRTSTTVSVIVFLILLAFKPVYSKVLYVDINNGSDDVTYQQNSESNPWLTIGRAMWGNTFRSSGNPAEAAQPGDTVIIAPGTYHQDQETSERFDPVLEPINNGVNGNPITFRAAFPASTCAPSNRTIITTNTNQQFGEPVIGSNGGAYLIFDGFYINERNVTLRNSLECFTVSANDANNISFVNMQIYSRDVAADLGYSSSTNHAAIYIEDSHNVTVSNCKLHGGFGSHHNISAILTYGTYNSSFYNNEIYDWYLAIHYKGDYNSPLQQGNNSAYYNLIHRIQQGFHFGIVVGTRGETEIYQNVITNSLSGSGGAAFVSRSYNSTSPSGIAIVNNTVNNMGDSIYGGGFYLKDGIGHADWRVYNNIITNSVNGIDAQERSNLPLSQFTFDYNYWADLSNTHLRINYSNQGFSYYQSVVGQGPNDNNSFDINYVNASENDLRISGSIPTGIDILDLDNDGQSNDQIAAGAYINDNVAIGNIADTGSGSDIIVDDPQENIPSIPGGLQIILSYID